MTEKTKKYKLANGLTVILDQNKASPVVSLNMGVKIGSAWEDDSESGLSHVLEHMVFKGTAHYAAGEIAKTVEACGGELNAYTSLDQTVYYINLSKYHLEKGLNLLKEMVFEAIIDPIELEREKEVVVEEIRRGKDSPSRLGSEALFNLAYPTHPYGRPVIGTEKNVRGFSPEKVKNFYKRWYSANNMILIICGDFDESALTNLIEKEFSGYEPHPINRPLIPHELTPTSTRFKGVKKNIEGSYLYMAYPAPDFVHKDVPALDLLAHLLGAGETSRLNQIVKEKKGLVNSINTYAYTPFYSGLFVIQATLPQGLSQKAFEEILLEIDHIKNNLVSLEDLKRAQNNFKSATYYDMETCEGSARKWMIFETTCGNYEYEKEYLKKISEVTPEDILEVAQKYLDLSKSALVLLNANPEKISLKNKSPIKVAQKKWECLDEYNGIAKFRLKNGLTVITRKNHRLPLVSIMQAGWGGVRYESPKNNGISQLMTNVMIKGTKNLNAKQIATATENISGSLNANAGKNTWGVSTTFLSEKWEDGLNLFSDVLNNPLFDENEFAKEKKWHLESIRQQEDSLSHLAFKKFHSLLYKKHPYGWPLSGTKKTISSLTPKDLKNYYNNLKNPEKMVLGAVGDFTDEALLNYLSSKTEEVAIKKVKTLHLKNDLPPQKLQKGQVKKTKKEQSHIVMGFMGTTVNNPDRYPLEVLNNVLSGQGGRLFLKLRDEQSLAYTVTATLMEGIEPGYFAVYIGCEPKKVDAAIEGIYSELQKIIDEKISELELARAQNYIIGNYAIDLQRNNTVVSTLVYNELYGMNLQEFDNYTQKILSVTREDIIRVAREYLTLKTPTIAIAGP